MTSSDQESTHAEGRFEIVNRLGLHARAASRLVQLASKFPCDVTLRQGDQVANGKSVMGVLLLCGSKGTFVEVKAQGTGAEEAVTSIGALIRDRFGEED
jgi:phosphocarrier protein HPr